MNQMNVFTLPCLLITGFIWTGCASDLEATDNEPVNQIEEQELGDEGPWSTTIDASEEEVWVYFDLDTREVLAAESNDGWDLGFQLTSIKSNGGSSGDGGVIVCPVQDAEFSALTTYPEDGCIQDMEDGEDDDPKPDYAFQTPLPWYTYTGPPDHVIVTNEVVYVVTSTEGIDYKVEVLDYYDQSGNARFVTFTWALLESEGEVGEVNIPVGEPQTSAAETYEENEEEDEGSEEETLPEIEKESGCYSGPPDHQCDCDVTEEQCEGMWTATCLCPVEGEEEGEEAGDADVTDGWGCYSGPPDHKCDCALTEEECGGIWTETCECP